MEEVRTSRPGTGLKLTGTTRAHACVLIDVLSSPIISTLYKWKNTIFKIPRRFLWSIGTKTAKTSSDEMYDDVCMITHLMRQQTPDQVFVGEQSCPDHLGYKQFS